MRKTKRSRSFLTKEHTSRKVYKKQKSHRKHKSRRVHKVARKRLSRSKRGGTIQDKWWWPTFPWWPIWVHEGKVADQAGRHRRGKWVVWEPRFGNVEAGNYPPPDFERDVNGERLPVGERDTASRGYNKLVQQAVNESNAQNPIRQLGLEEVAMRDAELKKKQRKEYDEARKAADDALVEKQAREKQEYERYAAEQISMSQKIYPELLNIAKYASKLSGEGFLGSNQPIWLIFTNSQQAEIFNNFFLIYNEYIPKDLDEPGGHIPNSAQTYLNLGNINRAAFISHLTPPEQNNLGLFFLKKIALITDGTDKKDAILNLTPAEKILYYKFLYNEGYNNPLQIFEAITRDAGAEQHKQAAARLIVAQIKEQKSGLRNQILKLNIPWLPPNPSSGLSQDYAAEAEIKNRWARILPTIKPDYGIQQPLGNNKAGDVHFNPSTNQYIKNTGLF